MDDVFSNIDDYNSRRKRKMLIVFDDTIADIMTAQKFEAIIKELFIRCRKYLIIKINNRKDLQQIAIDHSADID